MTAGVGHSLGGVSDIMTNAHLFGRDRSLDKLANATVRVRIDHPRFVDDSLFPICECGYDPHMGLLLDLQKTMGNRHCGYGLFLLHRCCCASVAEILFWRETSCGSLLFCSVDWRSTYPCIGTCCMGQFTS